MNQAPEKNFVFERFSDEAARVINQTGVRSRMAPMADGSITNACFDGIVAPDGRFYFPLSSESGECGTTKLAYFDYDQDKVIECFEAFDVLLHPVRKLPHSKFHTSLNIIPRHALYPECPYDEMDYLVVGTTHATDKAPHHPEWLPFGFHNHVWEGFPGSQILVYDPKSGHAMTLGTPVPRESIYGAEYDPKHNRLYMIGFMRGHIYCYDFNTRQVIKDLGKVAEIFCYRLVLGADGNIYGCSKSGQLFKIDTDKVEVEHLEFHAPKTLFGRECGLWYQYMIQGRNHPSGKYLYFVLSGNRTAMFRLEFATGEVTCVGDTIPKNGLFEEFGCVYGFDFDKDGVIWYTMQGKRGSFPPYVYFPHSYLIRWDPDNGEEPYVCGLLGRPERIQAYVTELEYDHNNDRLFWVDTVSGSKMRPSAGGVDLAQFRKVYRERGPVSNDFRAHDRLMTEEELQKYEERIKKGISTEENSADNPFQAWTPDKVEAIRVWRSLPRLEVEDSKVIGMAFDKKSKDYRWKLHVVSGRSGDFETAAFVMELVDGVVTKTQRFSEIDETYKAWLRENILPQPVNFDESIKLPEATGRRFRAKASCVVDWNNDRKFVGTLDALAAIVSADGSVYSLGNAAAYGPIRSMCTNKAKNHLWGVAGDDEDMGYVFEYDDVNGLRQRGIINYNIPNFSDGPSVANVLSSVCLSPDEKYLAIGSCDRIAQVHVMVLD
ncbi:MAG: hypothetical protein IKB80_00560 [Oscillospiraceae bacterium]|nr:hypothetical protein [Oscillospiraceae bacterium]